MFCITDCRLPRECAAALEARGCRNIMLQPDPSLPVQVASHADLIMHATRHSIIFRRGYAVLTGILTDFIANETGRVLVLSSDVAGTCYPYDTGFCACRAGKYLICRVESTDSLVLSAARDDGLEIVDVKQGYAKCSCAVCADGALITSDEGIARAMRLRGADVLSVSPGHVVLPGYECGFIGGASGLCGDTLFFAGRVENHPDSGRIFDFCRLHSTGIVSLGSGELFDVGSMFFI